MEQREEMPQQQRVGMIDVERLYKDWDKGKYAGGEIFPLVVDGKECHMGLKEVLRHLAIYVRGPSFREKSAEYKVQLLETLVELNAQLALNLSIFSICESLAKQSWMDVFIKHSAAIESDDIDSFCNKCEEYFILQRFYGWAPQKLFTELTTLAGKLYAHGIERDILLELNGMQSPSYSFSKKSKALFYAISFVSNYKYEMEYINTAYRSNLWKNIEIISIAGLSQRGRFMEVVQDGDVKCCEILMKWGMEIGEEHIDCAVAFSRSEVLKVLLRCCSEKMLKYAETKAEESRNREVINVFYEMGIKIQLSTTYKEQIQKPISLRHLGCIYHGIECRASLLKVINRNPDIINQVYILYRAELWDKSMHEVFKDIKYIEQHKVAATKLAVLIKELKTFFNFELKKVGGREIYGQKGIYIVQEQIAYHLNSNVEFSEKKFSEKIVYKDLFAVGALDSLIWIICHVKQFGFKNSNEILLQSMRFEQLETFRVLLKMYTPSPKILLHAVRCSQYHFVICILEQYKPSTPLLRMASSLAHEYGYNHIKCALQAASGNSFRVLQQDGAKLIFTYLNDLVLVKSIWRDDLIIEENVWDGTYQHLVTRINRIALRDVVSKLSRLQHTIVRGRYDVIYSNIMSCVEFVINSNIKGSAGIGEPRDEKAFDKNICLKQIVIGGQTQECHVSLCGSKRDIRDVLQSPQEEGGAIAERASVILHDLCTRYSSTPKWKRAFYTMCCLVDALPYEATSCLQREELHTALRSSVKKMFPEFASSLDKTAPMLPRISIEPIIQPFIIEFSKKSIKQYGK